jgi:hypothetical protein
LGLAVQHVQVAEGIDKEDKEMTGAVTTSA